MRTHFLRNDKYPWSTFSTGAYLIRNKLLMVSLLEYSAILGLWGSDLSHLLQRHTLLKCTLCFCGNEKRVALIMSFNLERLIIKGNYIQTLSVEGWSVRRVWTPEVFTVNRLGISNWDTAYINQKITVTFLSLRIYHLSTWQYAESWSHELSTPFPSCPGSVHQNEVNCSAFDMKMIFHSHANKTLFHKDGFALGLILKMRTFRTSEWPV